MELKPGERLDDLHIQGYQIIQDKKGFCFGIDAVLLAHFARIQPGEKSLDLGTGTGIIPLLMAGHHGQTQYDGLEIQEKYAKLARRSVAHNGLEDRIQIHQGDIKKASRFFRKSSYDLITCNPPYMKPGKGLVNPGSEKAIARHEILVGLEDIIRTAAQLVKVAGSLYMVHRPQRLTEIISVCHHYKMEVKGLRFVQPKQDGKPNLVLIEAVRHGKPMVTVEPTLVVYDDKGKYTDEINQIYGYNKKEK